MSMAHITTTHHERMAYVYVRQSTLWQVNEHQESTERQYRLQERALELGWPPTAIAVIDEDQGRSGSSATARTGFRRLISEVSLGQVGMVLMLEASRLARNSSDWHQLIELCGLSHTELSDESTVYDPRDPNDRLLLGVKGTLSEAELFTLRTRLHEGRWNKARKGLLQYPLPVGYVRASDGAWDLDPDQQVRERLAYLFEAFRRLGVARQVMRELKRNGLDLPTRVVSKGTYGTLIWKRPSTLCRRAHSGESSLCRSIYLWSVGLSRRFALTQDRQSAGPSPSASSVAGADPGASSRLCQLGGVHADERQQLRQNWLRDGSRGVARQGPALLQGIVWCGHCGRKMGVQHHAAKEKRSATYICQQGHQQDGEDTICQSMTARPVDAAVVQAFLEAVSPVGVEVAVRVLSQVEQQLQDLRRQWELQLEQARYEARLAQRKYDAVDPDNRGVPAELERRWNAQLTRVAELEQAYAKAEQEASFTLTPEERAAMQTLAGDLSAIWQAETTTSADRKQLLRLAIESVQLDGVNRPGWIEVQIRWRSGVVTRLDVKRAQPGEGSLKTPAQAVARIHELAADLSYAQIAEALKTAGWRTAFGRPFTSQHVGYICRRDGCGRKGPRALGDADQAR
jgi:DNA invertase Pin-like site-specific DNA recombinase